MSWRPRVAIRTAWLTSSGRASISSWAMYAPIDIPATRRTGPPTTASMIVAVSPTMVASGEPRAFSVAADAAVVEGDAPVVGPLEGGIWKEVPGASGAPRPAMNSTGSLAPPIVEFQAGSPARRYRRGRTSRAASMACVQSVRRRAALSRVGLANPLRHLAVAAARVRAEAFDVCPEPNGGWGRTMDSWITWRAWAGDWPAVPARGRSWRTRLQR